MATFTTKQINELPDAGTMYDGCFVPICQDGTAKRITGAAFKAYITSMLRNMSVDAETLPSGVDATVECEVDSNGNIALTFGIPVAELPDGDGVFY